MDLLVKEINKLTVELNTLGKRIFNIEKDINKICENLDFIKEQNLTILNKISKVEDKEKFPDLKTTEAIESINKKVNNLNNKPNQDIDSIIKNLDKLSLRNTGKEKVNRKLSTTFYKYE